MSQAIADDIANNAALDVPVPATATATATANANAGKKRKQSEGATTVVEGGSSKAASGSSVPASASRVVPSITVHGPPTGDGQDYEKVTILRPKSYLAQSEDARFKANEKTMTAWATKVDIESRVAKGAWNLDNICDLASMTLISAQATKEVLATEAAKNDELRRRFSLVDEERKDYIRKLHTEKDILNSLKQELMLNSQEKEKLIKKLAAAEEKERKAKKDLDDLGAEMMPIYVKSKACLKAAAVDAYLEITAPEAEDRTPDAFAKLIDKWVKKMEWQNAQPVQPVQPE